MLKPGGRFVLAGHGPSSNPIIRAGMRLAEPASVRTAADYLTRDPRPFLQQAGFQIDSVSRMTRGISFRVVASRPAPPASPAGSDT